MKAVKAVKAVIFDVYHTLLEVSDGPVDAEAQWQAGRPDFSGGKTSGSLAEFDAACRAVVARDHAERKRAGARWPEVDWRSVARRAAPGLAGLDEAALDAFLVFHARLQRRTGAMAGAQEFLTDLRHRGILTGIASNAQNYTLAEMQGSGLWPQEFIPELCFWSFQHGFSKPDPQVFSLLTEKLETRGILPEETLMIGDRLDNDIAPARGAGWQTWHFQGTWPLGAPRVPPALLPWFP